MVDGHILAIEYETLALSRHMANAVGRARRNESLLEASAYTLLSLLQAGGPASIGTLSAITGLDTSTINRQTAALARDGFVTREPDASGGLARIFCLSSAGEAALHAEQEQSRKALAATLAGWQDDEREELAQTLRRFNAAIEQQYALPWPRPADGGGAHP